MFCYFVEFRETMMVRQATTAAVRLCAHAARSLRLGDKLDWAIHRSAHLEF